MDSQELLKQIEKLKKERDEALKKVSMKSLFFSNISHEIRTPVNAIMGMTNILLDENPNEEQTEILLTMKFSADNLMRLLNDILLFSKIESEKIELEEIEINLPEFINLIKQGFIEVIKRKNLEFITMVDPKIPNPILGDSLRLSQILSNLIGNAIKFTYSGKVIVEVKFLDQTANFVKLEFSVKDTGIGIEKSKLKEIFDSFSQGALTTSREFGGTGLGLAIAKKILERMDSKIEVESEPSKGSCFSFQLYLTTPTVKVEPIKIDDPKKVVERKSLKGLRLLLVEDNPSNQKVAMRYLQKWDIDAHLAENGIICLEKMKNSIYDLVLMDLQMPEMDGYTAAAEIRKKNEQVPIIALTASALLDTQRKVQNAGMNDYLTKPFVPEDLYNSIAKYYKKK